MITPTKPYTFDRVVRLVLTVLTIIGIFYVLNLLSGALLPFVVAWLIAYLLNPTVHFFQDRLFRGNRLLAVMTTLLAVALVITTFVVTLVPSIISEFNYTMDTIRELSAAKPSIPIVERAWYQSLIEAINIKEVSQIIEPEEWSKLLESTLNVVWTLFSGSVNQIINIAGWLIVGLYLIFIMVDYQRVADGFRNLIPERYRDIIFSVLSDVESGMKRYFRGQSLIALIVGVLFTIGFVIVGLPLAIPVGIFVGLLNLVPYLQIIGFIPIIILCLLDHYTGGQNFWTQFGGIMVVFVVVQSIQELVLVPRIMGKVTGFRPAVILLSLSIGGTLLGLLGMIIALPVTSLLISYYRKYVLCETETNTDTNTGTDTPTTI